MAGYCGYSKSNNAIDAEQEDKFNATQLAEKLGCSSAAIKQFLTPHEWHHTSCRYNETDYYYEPELLVAAGAISIEGYEYTLSEDDGTESDKLNGGTGNIGWASRVPKGCCWSHLAMLHR